MVQHYLYRVFYGLIDLGDDVLRNSGIKFTQTPLELQKRKEDKVSVFEGKYFKTSMISDSNSISTLFNFNCSFNQECCVKN